MQCFYVLGHPIAHSYSPIMHNASFRAIGYKGEYGKLDVPPEQLSEALLRLQANGCVGVNLTVPLKEIALSLMNELSPRARKLGAVNTVRISSRGFYGDNTDADGLIDDLTQTHHFNLTNLPVAIVGCGGAGRAIAIALKDSGAKLKLFNRSAERLHKLADELAPIDAYCGTDDWIAPLLTCELIIHCTPAGIRPNDSSLLPKEAFREGQFLYDIVIRPGSLSTPTLDTARIAGARGCNGIGMLVGQGARAFTIWTGLQADRVAMTQAIQQAILA